MKPEREAPQRTQSELQVIQFQRGHYKSIVTLIYHLNMSYFTYHFRSNPLKLIHHNFFSHNL